MRNFLFGAAFLLLSLVPQKSDAQIGRSDWYGAPVFQTNNFVYNAVGVYLTQVPLVSFFDFSMKDIAWWFPQFRYRANIIQELEFDAGKASIRPKAWGFGGIDWKLRNYSVGYKIGYLSRVFPVGFEVEADYVQDGYNVKMPWAEEKNSMIKRMISASALMKIRLLDYDSNRYNPIIEVGGSYNYALHYHDGLVDDKDAVNNGFTGIIGIGLTNTENHVSWTLRYEQPFYVYHNEDFVYEGNKIFSGAKSKFGSLGASMSWSF